MARDLFHNSAKKSLENDGWEVTHDPFLIPINSRGIYADLGAERTLAAQKGKELIVVEIKSFIGLSVITDFYKAVGQYEIYFQALKKFFPERKLYLAIPESGYNNLVKDPFLQEVLVNLNIKLIVFKTDTEQISKWIK
jgi:XisH protein